MKLEHGDLIHVRDPITGSIDLAQYKCPECYFGDDDPHALHAPYVAYFGTDFTSYMDEIEVVEKLVVQPVGRR